MLTAAFLRARKVLGEAGIRDAGALERVPSVLNEVWYAGPYVIRISANPDSRRLRYESLLAAHLPKAVKYPEIVTYGRSNVAEWLIVRRVEGEPLSRAWPEMSERQRRDAVEEIGGALRELHQVAVPPIEGLAPPFLGETLECPHQLPASRIRQLLEQARGLPGVSHTVLDQAHVLVDEAESALDPAPVNLIHGDLHFENVLWDGNQISAILDFEFARPEAPDVDLDVILRFCADPFLHVADDYAHLARRSDYREVPAWLRDAYPEIFAHPRVQERLSVYSLSYELRHLLLRPPTGPVDPTETFHPYNRMRRAIEGHSYLAWVQW